jgi:hypothetical protein
MTSFSTIATGPGKKNVHSKDRMKAEFCLCCGILGQIKLLRCIILLGCIGLMIAFMPLGQNDTKTAVPSSEKALLIFMP